MSVTMLFAYSRMCVLLLLLLFLFTLVVPAVTLEYLRMCFIVKCLGTSTHKKQTKPHPYLCISKGQ